MRYLLIVLTALIWGPCMLISLGIRLGLDMGKVFYEDIQKWIREGT